MTQITELQPRQSPADLSPVPESVEATLAYLVPQAAKPVIDLTVPGERSDINGRFETVPVEIRNGRWRRDDFSLDAEGFAFTNHETALARFNNDEIIRRIYYPEMERLLKRETGAAHVLVFDHNVRVDGGHSTGSGYGVVRTGVRRIHNDYTATSAPRRAGEILKDKGAEALAGRPFAIVNVWRPIHGPVQTAPLALADAQSVTPQDVVKADLVYKDRTGEIYYANHNPMHRWFYFPRMRADEAIFIKGYDSRKDGRAGFSLHTAFDDPSTPQGAAPRESIEVRALVVFD